MIGKLILVSGVSGAGKTTLIREALEQLDLTYLLTYTTRPKRQGEESSNEYVFVTKEEYGKLRSSSALWDHTEYGGFDYGADVEKTKRLLSDGENVICSVAPDAKIIRDMSQLYDYGIASIWIDTPKSVAATRLSGDKARATRVEGKDAAGKFDYIFVPMGSLDNDKHSFVELVSKITK